MFLRTATPDNLKQFNKQMLKCKILLSDLRCYCFGDLFTIGNIRVVRSGKLILDYCTEKYVFLLMYKSSFQLMLVKIVQFSMAYLSFVSCRVVDLWVCHMSEFKHNLTKMYEFVSKCFLLIATEISL